MPKEEEEFFKYIKDYLSEHPEEQLYYWSEYPPHGNKGRHYSIFTIINKEDDCLMCHQPINVFTGCAGESGLTFEIEIEECKSS